jgi:guanylate kinase
MGPLLRTLSTATDNGCVIPILQGVKQVKKTDLNARFLFLAPPSIEELERRLRSRGTETEESIRKRVEQAKKEMEYAANEGSHEKVVVNDDLETAYREMEEWIMAGENLRM